MNDGKEKIESFLDSAKVWSFNVKFNNTDDNWRIVDGFKKFCKENSSDNYLLGIKMLTDYFESDFKYASLFDNIESVRADLLAFSTKVEDSLSSSVSVDENEEGKLFKTFGEE